mmetsp:Transcript_914/g.1703  ORF Transcript_914/g.1703 Transcript_914/m.1703 type:complete len:203 (-) Transcript_914:431-1039(-)
MLHQKATAEYDGNNRVWPSVYITRHNLCCCAYLLFGYADYTWNIRMITWYLITPLINNIVSLHNESTPQTKNPFRDLPKFHILWNRRQFTDISHVLHPSSKSTQVRCFHFKALKIFLGCFVKPTKASTFVGCKTVVVYKSLIPRYIGIQFEKRFKFLGISNGDKDRTLDGCVSELLLLLELTPRFGVTPAIWSSHVTQENNH